MEADILFFQMEDTILAFDPERGTLSCRSRDGAMKWLRRMETVTFIASVIEDADSYYVMGETEETTGEYLALDRGNGITRWFIPGRAFMHVIHDGFLYLIFIDEKMLYWLIKVEREKGTPLWHRAVKPDLQGYRFRKDRIILTYRSGHSESLSPESGNVLA